MKKLNLNMKQAMVRACEVDSLVNKRENHSEQEKDMNQDKDQYKKNIEENKPNEPRERNKENELNKPRKPNRLRKLSKLSKPKETKQGIQINSLSWRPQKESKKILDNLNCFIEKGNIYGIIGPNGSGKTTLVRNILRFIEPQEGNLVLDELNLKAYKRKELATKIALVPQNTALESSFQAEDIVMMGRIPYQKRFADASDIDREMVKKAMVLTDSYEYREKIISTLSGGEAQRIITARAIAQDTEWLILDEPTSSLDVKHQIDLMNSLMTLNKENDKTIIAVLHDLNIAAAYCNRIIMMKNGRIHTIGKTDEVLTKENLRDVYEIDFDVLENPRTGKQYYVPV